MSTQNVNVAHFARNIEWDFFCDFQTWCNFQDCCILWRTNDEFVRHFNYDLHRRNLFTSITFGTIIRIMVLVAFILQSKCSNHCFVGFWCILSCKGKHSVWKSQKKSHSTLQAKQATFTFLVDKSWFQMPKMANLPIFFLKN